MHPWTLELEQILAFPVDELALHILADVAANDATPNRYNWLNQVVNSGYYAGPRETDVLRALSEAWTWLITHRLVASDPRQTNSDWLFITRLGRRVLEEGIEPLHAETRLMFELHPRLERKVRRQFLMGEYETAVFVGMKEVEVRVREMVEAPDSEIGRSLINRAFGPGGVLFDENLDRGESDAVREMFSGALGVFKNPSSHREIEFDNPTHAAEAVLLADLLMRILDRLEPK